MDNYNNKLSNSCEENPKLGHNHRSVKNLSYRLQASRSGLPSSYKKYYIVKYTTGLTLKDGYQ